MANKNSYFFFSFVVTWCLLSAWRVRTPWAASSTPASPSLTQDRLGVGEPASTLGVGFVL